MRTAHHWVASDKLDHPYIPKLYENARWYNWPTRVLPIPLQPDEKFSFIWKLRTLLRAAKMVHPDDLIIFTDAFDVIINNAWQTTIDQALEALEFYQVQILVASETNCWPSKTLQSFFDGLWPQIPNRYPNTGLIVGRAGHIVQCLEDLQVEQEPPFDRDDQHVFIRAMVRQSINLKDHDLNDPSSDGLSNGWNAEQWDLIQKTPYTSIPIGMDMDSRVMLCAHDREDWIDHANHRKGIRVAPLIHFNGTKTGIPKAWRIAGLQTYESDPSLVSKSFYAELGIKPSSRCDWDVLLWIISILCLILLGLGAYFFYSSKSSHAFRPLTVTNPNEMSRLES